MPAPTRQTPRHRLCAPWLAVIAALGASAARADEPSPYYIGVSETLTHDTNVYRTTAPISDTYSTTSLLGGFDQAVGRQRFYGAATVGFNKYRSQDTLDNTSYGANAGWDWQTINNLAGGVSVSANQSLATQNGNQAVVDGNGTPIPPTQTRNIVKTEQLSTYARWGGAGPLSLTAAYAHSKVDYSDTLASESSGDTFSFGTGYQLGPTVNVGAGLRFTRSRSPYGIALVANPTTRDDYASTSSTGRNLDLTLGWRLSAQTGVDARLSFTRQSNSNGSNSDFSGLTGGLSANYAPTAKLSFNASYSRDAGTNGAFFNTPPTATTDTTTGVTTITPGAVLLSQNSTVSDSVGFGAAYAATAKISANAGLQYRRSRNGGDNGFSTEYTDKLFSESLGLSYAAGRNWNLGCRFSHEARDVSGTTAFSYSDNTVSCTVQLTLR